jgi:hypothetical protein
MDEDSTLKVAVQRAWNLHLATHDDVDASDQRRCSLEGYLSRKWQAGESDPEELACCGLSYQRARRFVSQVPDCSAMLGLFAFGMCCR